MTPYWQDSHTTILQGDAREVLRGLPDGSVHCVVTSPPPVPMFVICPAPARERPPRTVYSIGRSQVIRGENR